VGAVLILLPPSEGKSAPRRGKPLELGSLSFPDLHQPRAEVLDALVELSTGDPGKAAEVLGLGATQADEVRRNAGLATAPTARADQVYTGVLYEALGLPTLNGSAKRRAASWVAVTSGLFGLLRPGDRIPAYRLSGTVKLPGVGPVARHWSRHLASSVVQAAGDGLVVDLRSGAYAPFWRPARAQAPQVVTVRVLHEVDGRRTVVSHFNKATKGRLVRDLLLDGSTLRRPGQLVELLGDLAWQVESEPAPAGQPTRVDVVVTQV
jgi:cytoplasmic iron level regulating protein YaaA (DUF328/UPF0246 family)